MIEEVEGFIINEQNYGETSKIINVFTKKYGIISLMTKGAKKIKSPFFNKVNKFTFGVFNLQYKKNKISTLISIDVIDYFKNIKRDIEKITYASIISELVNQICKTDVNEKIYDIYKTTMMKINEGFTGLGMTDIFKLRMLPFLGVELNLDSCSVCGSKKDIITLSCSSGGYICKNCYNNEKIISESAIKLIRAFNYLDISNISKFDVSDTILLEIAQFIDEYYELYTGIYLKSNKLLGILEKIN